MSRCTHDFALCGISAEVARPPSATSHSNQDGEHFSRPIPVPSIGKSNTTVRHVFCILSAAHIHRLLFHCCYACSLKETWIPVATTSIEYTNNGADPGRATVPVRVGVEFQPEARTEPVTMEGSMAPAAVRKVKQTAVQQRQTVHHHVPRILSQLISLTPDLELN